MESRLFHVDELVIPQRPGAAGWPDFVAAADVRNVVESSAYGSDVLGYTARELLPGWLTPRHTPRRLFVARAGTDIVARAVYETQADPASTHAWFAVDVLPEFRHQGIGTALADRLDALAEAENRTITIVYAVSPDAAGARLSAPTGFGSVPAANPEVRFLLRRGYRLEQVERGSILPLPVNPRALASLGADAAARAGTDYALLSWTGLTPERWLEDMAVLRTRMSTDAPSAGLAEPEDVWTVDRVLADQEAGVAGPRVALVTAVLHRPSGRIIGFTELSVPSDPRRAVEQQDTLVLAEHRGHRLGMLMKVANLQRLALEFPEQTAVTTFNAEENRYMLDVNEALGFRPMGYEGGWRRVSAAAGSEGSSATNGS